MESSSASVSDSTTTPPSPPSDVDVLDRISELLRGSGDELDAYLSVVVEDVPVDGTLARAHCRIVSLGGNKLPRTADLAHAILMSVVGYAIPRSEIESAQEADRRFNDTRRMTELVQKARTLFSSLKDTGECGELLLYLLAQSVLRLPQAFCKMPHKTSENMHVHGVDGIHVGYENPPGVLSLYWCEAKLKADVSASITDCLNSLMPFLCAEGDAGAEHERDLQLMRDNLDLGDPDLEEAILRYLDPADPLHNTLEIRGICLIGFDESFYPSQPNSSTEAQVVASARQAFTRWVRSLKRNIESRAPLAKVSLHAFLVPFPSVDSFRAAFLKELNRG